MHTPDMPTSPAPSDAVVVNHDGETVVSVAALLARLDLVDDWDDLREVLDVLRTITGGEPRLTADKRVRPEFRQPDQPTAWQTILGRLEEWGQATDPDARPAHPGDDAASAESVTGERRRALVAERRRLRYLKVGRWDHLRITWDGWTGRLQGRVEGDEGEEAWTYVSQIESPEGRRDLVISGLLRDAEQDGYDPDTVAIADGVNHG